MGCLRSTLALSFLVLATACTNDSAACMEGRDLVGETPLPPEISGIFERNCWICHTDPPAGFAPFPLLTWEQVQRARSPDAPTPVYEVIADRIRDPLFPMPPLPPPNLSDADRETWPALTETEKDTIERWVADCAPPAD